MKKITALSALLVMTLLLCLMDARRQYEGRKKNVQEVTAQGTVQLANTAEIQGTIPSVNAAETQKEIIQEAAAQEVLASSEETMIRVLIKTAGFDSEYHEQVRITAAEGFTITDGAEVRRLAAEEELCVSADTLAGDTLRLYSANGEFFIHDLSRDGGDLPYAGELEIRKTENGLLLINELPLEEYLCAVVPSEMPSNYPQEALKAQAVCARTYALRQIQEGRCEEFFADVDDSVSYQVYNNQPRADSTDLAVKESAGEVLTNDAGLVETLYYSTSCGLDTKLDLSQETVFAAFLSGNNIKAFEAQEPWYRWQTDISLAALPGVTGLEISEREESGMATALHVIYKNGNEQFIEGEYKIREFLAAGMQNLILQSGEQVEGMKLLPSAFFVLEQTWEGQSLVGYHVLGGGYGHGQGMSQNGAKHMAQEGMDYREILNMYYDDAQITTASKQPSALSE